MAEQKKSPAGTPEFTHESAGQLQRKDGFFVIETLPFEDGQLSVNYSILFTAYFPCEVYAATEVHAVAANAAGSVNMFLEKLIGTTAPGAGDAINVTAWNLESTPNTPVLKRGKDFVTGVSADGVPIRILSPGDRLAWRVSQDPTDLENINISVYLKPFGRGDYY